MRVNPNPLPDLLAALNERQLEAQRGALEIASGRRVNQPSDDPVAAALLVQNNDSATFNEGYLQNLTAVNGQLSSADSALSSVITALHRAITLGVQAGNSILSDSDRQAIAQELQGIQSQVMSLANTSYQGNYLFAGTATDIPPFITDSGDPSGVTYQGNDGVNQVAIGSGYLIAVNQPGEKLFSQPGNGVFLALNNLIQAIQSGTGIDTAVGAVNSASAYLSSQRVFFGNAMNQIQSETTYLNTAKLQIAQEQNTLCGVDLAKAATDLSQAQGDVQAALAAIGQIAQTNLFDYLK